MGQRKQPLQQTLPHCPSSCRWVLHGCFVVNFCMEEHKDWVLFSCWIKAWRRDFMLLILSVRDHSHGSLVVPCYGDQCNMVTPLVVTAHSFGILLQRGF